MPFTNRERVWFEENLIHRFKGEVNFRKFQTLNPEPFILDVKNTEKKEKETMAKILVLARYNSMDGSETLVGFYDNEDAIQEALKEVVKFRIDGTDVKVARDFTYRVHPFNTNVRVMTEAFPQPKFDHGDVHTYFTVYASNKKDTYGIAVDENGTPLGCTCMSWQTDNYVANSCKHMLELGKELATATGRKKIGWAAA